VAAVEGTAELELPPGLMQWPAAVKRTRFDRAQALVPSPIPGPINE
jgi:hypothetical protein